MTKRYDPVPGVDSECIEMLEPGYILIKHEESIMGNSFATVDKYFYQQHPRVPHRPINNFMDDPYPTKNITGGIMSTTAKEITKVSCHVREIDYVPGKFYLVVFDAGEVLEGCVFQFNPKSQHGGETGQQEKPKSIYSYNDLRPTDLKYRYSFIISRSLYTQSDFLAFQGRFPCMQVDPKRKADSSSAPGECGDCDLSCSVYKKYTPGEFRRVFFANQNGPVVKIDKPLNL